MPGWWNADTLSLEVSGGNLVQVQVLFPVPNIVLVAQLDRAPPCEGGSRRFESYLGRQIMQNSYFLCKTLTMKQLLCKRLMPLKHLGMMSDLVSPRTRFDSVLRHQTWPGYLIVSGYDDGSPAVRSTKNATRNRDHEFMQV